MWLCGATCQYPKSGYEQKLGPFSVADPLMWNCLPLEVTSAPSLATFRTPLETFLFPESYPDIRLV